jgi:Uma2 family endonuclease
MSTAPPKITARETIADLARAEGQAELIGGRVVHLMATGIRPNIVAGRIFRSLADHVDASGLGVAFTDNIGFIVPELKSGRESFSPDVSFYSGPFSYSDMRFLHGPPTLAIEVRSEGDYGPAAERLVASKRADYFEAGTLVVWDVDPKADLVHSYQSANPEQPTTFRRGQDADAEPALPGWTIAIDRIFP